ncbi:MAG: hypothetical protein ACPHOJ_07180, partial [Litorivicinaceae bacterium]
MRFDCGEWLPMLSCRHSLYVGELLNCKFFDDDFGACIVSIIRLMRNPYIDILFVISKTLT